MVVEAEVNRKAANSLVGEVRIHLLVAEGSQEVTGEVQVGEQVMLPVFVVQSWVVVAGENLRVMGANRKAEVG